MSRSVFVVLREDDGLTQIDVITEYERVADKCLREFEGDGYIVDTEHPEFRQMGCSAWIEIHELEDGEKDE